ncbi:MAG: RsmD family RNA methyltransferase [Flavobacteriales bacterium]|jgi:16S rRNA (guanine966-N2)-methyltransferase|tara:strand:+ start:406 stop:975 length:570 start_codon:yes stop_codon:yes gene_type:complete
MRIVSGTHKSKRITAPKNLPVRPTTDMAKESLFNILNNNYYFDEVRVLDLFSGTGNISYEFASRGTEHILCIDENVNCIRFIQKTAKELGFESISTVKADAFEFLDKHKQEHDIIFADAPYELEGLDKIVAAVFAKKILSQDGVLVIEHSKEQDFSELPYFVNSRRYGNVNFSFFEWEEEDEDEQEVED